MNRRNANDERVACAQAQPNIALVLPMVRSLSITLANARTRTRVCE